LRHFARRGERLLRPPAVGVSLRAGPPQVIQAGQAAVFHGGTDRVERVNRNAA